MRRCTHRTQPSSTLVAILMGSKAVLVAGLLLIDSARVLIRTIKPFEISFSRNFELTFLLPGRDQSLLLFNLTLLLLPLL